MVYFRGIISALRQTQSLAEESAYVGDTLSRDVIGSKRAGFAVAIQICSQLTKMKDAGVDPAFRPDYMVGDIFDVLCVIRQVNAAT